MMAEAFKCDRCGELREGKPVTQIVGLDVTLDLVLKWSVDVACQCSACRRPGQPELCRVCVSSITSGASTTYK